MDGLPPPGPTTRRKILPHEIEAIRGGRGIEGIFIGRPSTWGNPYKIGRDGGRAEVVRKYLEHLNSSGLRKFVGELRGCTLVCFCDLKEQCHGDVLIKLADGPAQNDVALINEDYQAVGTTDDYAQEADKRGNHIEPLS